MAADGDFRAGVKDGVPIALGYYAISIAFGLFCVQTGLSPLVATVISATNLSSSGQFAGVAIMAQVGSLVEIAVTVLLINLRYVLMSFSLSQRVPREVGVGRRLVMGYGVTDEIFALAMQRPVVSSAYYLGLMTLPVAGWTLGTLTGALVGEILPEQIARSMGILLYAMFVAIVVPVAKKSGKVALVVAIAVAVSVVLSFVPLALGWRLIIATCVAAGLGATFFPVDGKKA